MIIWGYITMDFEQDVMDGEIDKVINIHAIMMGRQLILCKRRDITHESAYVCLLYTSPSPRDRQKSRMPSSA